MAQLERQDEGGGSELSECVRFILSSTFINKTVAQKFDKANQLLNSSSSSETTIATDDKITRLITWARLCFHVQQLLGDDASQKLLEESVSASRRVLCYFDSQDDEKNSKKNNNNTNEKMKMICNYMIRESVSRLFPGIRVCLSGGNEGARIMVAAQDSTPNEIICKEEPFAVWKGTGIENGLDAITDSTADLKHEKSNSLWCPDLHLSEAISTFLAKKKSLGSTSSSSSTFSSSSSTSTAVMHATREECRVVASLRANCHHYTKERPKYADPESNERKKENDNTTSSAASATAAASSSSPSTSTSSSSSSSSSSSTFSDFDHIAVFDVLSKISHSCAPNCFYDGTGRLISSGTIPRGAILGFSYFHKKLLLRGTNTRRKAMDESHHFLCGCPRCSSPSTAPQDHGRSFLCKSCSNGAVCECFSVLANSTNNQNNSSNNTSFSFTAVPGFHLVSNPVVPESSSSSSPSSTSSSSSSTSSSKWICSSCGDTASDAEISKFLYSEARLDESTTSNFAQIVTSANTTHQLPKNIFEPVRGDLLESLQVLGKHHWLYLETVRVMIQFFVRIAVTGPKVSKLTVTVALEFAVRWAFKFVSAAALQGIFHACPSAPSSYAFEPARYLLERAPHSKWRIHAALILQLAIESDPSFAKRNDLSAEMLSLSAKSLEIHNNSEENVFSMAANNNKPSETAVAGVNNKNKNKNKAPMTALQSEIKFSQQPKTALQAICKAAEMDVDDGNLILEWETHLADRVAAMMQTRTSQSDALRSHFNFPK